MDFIDSKLILYRNRGNPQLLQFNTYIYQFCSVHLVSRKREKIQYMVFVKQHFWKLKKIYALQLCVKNHWIIQQQKPPPPLNFKDKRRIHKGIELKLKWDTLIWTISTLPTQPHPPCRKGSSTYTRANGSKTTTFTLSLFMTKTRGEGNIKFQTVCSNDIFRSFCPQAMNTKALYLMLGP